MTVKEKVLVHLSRYSNVPYESVNVPYELTQDGIGNIVGVSRAHISLELRTLVSKGEVVCWKAHIHGCSSRRFAYIPTAKGVKTATVIIQNFEEYGYDPTMALDMKRCEPAETWEAMSDADRDVLGIACLFRTPAPRCILPRTAVAAIPITPDGKMAIPAATARSYLSFAEPARIRFWHTWIAEYWSGEGKWAYALYHFIMAKELGKAEECLLLHRNDVIGEADKDTLRALKKVPDEDMRAEFKSALAEVSMNLGDFKIARKAIDELKEMDHYSWTELDADYLLRTGEPAEAAKAADEAFVKTSSMHAAAMAAEAFAAVDELETSSAYAKKAAELMAESGDTYDLDRIFAARAVVAYKSRDKSLCLLMHSRALENAPNCRVGLRKSQMEKAKALLEDRR